MSDIKDANRALKFLQKSGLVNLEVPLSKLVAQTSDLEIAGGGSILIWSQWILISPPCPRSAIVAIGERAEVGAPSSGMAVGEAQAPGEKD